MDLSEDGAFPDAVVAQRAQVVQLTPAEDEVDVARVAVKDAGLCSGARGGAGAWAR